MRKPEWAIGLIYLSVLAALALAGQWARRGAERTCAYDGGKIEPLYRVRVVTGQERGVEFCCIRCAELWLRNQKEKPQAIFVTDEMSGEEIDASSASFVRTRVVTNRTTNNRVHAFRRESDAESHVRATGGVLLGTSERPFAGLGCAGCLDCCDP